MKRLLLIFAMGLLTGGCGINAWAAPKTIALPITLDYPWIRSVLVNQVYTQPGQKAVLLDQNNRCVRIELSDPGIRSDGSSMLLMNKVKMEAGLEWGKRCRRPVDWQGYVEIRIRPYWEKETWRLRFEIQDTNFYNQHYEKSRVARIVWKIFEKYVYPPLDRVTIDLAPPINRVVQLLPFFVQPEQEEKFKRILRSFRPGPLRIGLQAVEAELLLDLDLPEGRVFTPGPEPLDESEKERFIRIWEAWDSFLVHQLLSLVGQPLTEEEGSTLMKVLLEIRYGFVNALNRRSSERDLVREQFIKTWNHLGPIMKKHLLRKDSPSLFGYLGYFTAMDSLKVLDDLGPAFGLEINENGLIRLARMLSSEKSPWSPGYSWEVDPALRRIFGLNAPIPETGPISKKMKSICPHPEMELFRSEKISTALSALYRFPNR